MDPDHPTASVGETSNAEILVADAINGQEGTECLFCGFYS